jgi:mRNA interferase MazF
MSKARYAPQRGDVININFSPQQGHEQAGFRPALVLSPVEYNRKTHLVVVLAITNQAKGYPFEEPIPAGHPVTGVILSDQIRTMDWVERKATHRCGLPGDVIERAFARFITLMPELDPADDESDEGS